MDSRPRAPHHHTPLVDLATRRLHGEPLGQVTTSFVYELSGLTNKEIELIGKQTA